MKHSRNLVLISSYLTSLKSDKVITVKEKNNFLENMIKVQVSICVCWAFCNTLMYRPEKLVLGLKNFEMILVQEKDFKQPMEGMQGRS